MHARFMQINIVLLFQQSFIIVFFQFQNLEILTCWHVVLGLLVDIMQIQHIGILTRIAGVPGSNLPLTSQSDLTIWPRSNFEPYPFQAPQSKHYWAGDALSLTSSETFGQAIQMQWYQTLKVFYIISR